MLLLCSIFAFSSRFLMLQFNNKNVYIFLSCTDIILNHEYHSGIGMSISCTGLIITASFSRNLSFKALQCFSSILSYVNLSKLTPLCQIVFFFFSILRKAIHFYKVLIRAVMKMQRKYEKNS